MWPHGARSVSHWDYRWSCQKRSPWKKKSSFKMQWSLWFKNGNWKVFRSLLLSILRFRVKRTKRRRMLNPVDVFICLSAQPWTSTHLRNNRPPYRPEKLISAQPLTTPTNNWPYWQLKKTKFYYETPLKIVRGKWTVKNLLWNIVMFCCKNKKLSVLKI